MHRHLIAVEVGVVCRADQGVQLDRLAFNQQRLERLDTQTVKCWRAVQEHWMLTNDFSQDIPNFGSLALHHFLRSFDRRRQTTGFKLRVDEWLE